MKREAWWRKLDAHLAGLEEPPTDDAVDLLRILSQDPRNAMVELTPGVYRVDRTRNGWAATG